MKKILIVLITIATMLSYTLAPAASCDYQDNTYTLGNGTLEEYVDASGQIIRYYEKTEQPTSSRNIFSLSSAQASGDSDTKELLRLLGLRESFVDELSQEQLAMYANARSISSITTYSVSDQNGNVMIIPEEIAIRNTSSSAKAPLRFPRILVMDTVIWILNSDNTVIHICP